MNIEFKHGAMTVSRIHKDGTSHMLGAFQFIAHASLFARLMAGDETQPRGIDVAMVNCCDGSVTVYRQPAAGDLDPRK